MKTIGLIILITGIVMILFTGVKFITREKKIDLGSIEIVEEKTTPVYWSPWTGVFFVCIGGSILILTRKKLEV